MLYKEKYKQFVVVKTLANLSKLNCAQSPTFCSRFIIFTVHNIFASFDEVNYYWNNWLFLPSSSPPLQHPHHHHPHQCCLPTNFRQHTLDQQFLACVTPHYSPPKLSWRLLAMNSLSNLCKIYERQKTKRYLFDFFHFWRQAAAVPCGIRVWMCVCTCAWNCQI